VIFSYYKHEISLLERYRSELTSGFADQPTDLADKNAKFRL